MTKVLDNFTLHVKKCSFGIGDEMTKGGYVHLRHNELQKLVFCNDVKLPPDTSDYEIEIALNSCVFKTIKELIKYSEVGKAEIIKNNKGHIVKECAEWDWELEKWFMLHIFTKNRCYTDKEYRTGYLCC